MKKCVSQEEKDRIFIDKACKIHGNRYDYSKVNYINSQTKVCIICPIHGEFWQTPNTHLDGHLCPKCAKDNMKNKMSDNTETFIRKAREIHGDKYDYSKVEYKNYNTKVCIICHEKNEFGEEHGEFWQRPEDHINGYGCRKCSKTYMNTDYFIKKRH